ncbi:MAG TPA: tRNA pseudouridine(38-40) synthase TruA [Flavobacteriales bacterium]|nr:tRNA pseudouridine(38-40) synthase TruA [Flavobacteriales bacterium]
MRYFVNISFSGTCYHGWQKQPNAQTVQAEVERALGLLTGNNQVETTGCGRTDTGVHATCFYFHVDLKDLKFSLENLKFKLNRLLPGDIAVMKIYEVDPEAHARYDATYRKYEYRVHHQKNAFINESSSFLHKIPDYAKMNEAAKILFAHNDFASFCKAHAGSQTTICKIEEAEWRESRMGWTFHIAADRFLRNMVRAIVGTLLEVGYGKMSLNEFNEVIESKKRTEAGESVPAHGLFLTQEKYPYING